MLIKDTWNLFLQYSAIHAELHKPGFPLMDMSGECVGYIDRISVRRDRLFVEGWTHFDRTGLKNAEHAVECTPNLSREDVLNGVSNIRNMRPGFALELPITSHQTVFWASKGTSQCIHALPQFHLHELRRMRMKQAIPFLKAATRALPAALRCLIYRDLKAAAEVKNKLGLQTKTLVAALDTRLFAEGHTVPGTSIESAVRTGITIILPIYNAFELLPEALQRILSNTDLPWRLIVVEDCSSDKRVRPWLRDWHSGLPPERAAQINLLENTENLGFIRSVNRAMELALSYDDHVILLNSDAFVPALWASRLIRPLLEHDNIATVTPMANDAEIFSVPVICQPGQLLPGEADAIDKIAAQFFSGADQAEAPTGVGFCMAMNIDFLRRFPEFDPGFGRGYGEEVDWCQRARQSGGRHIGLGGLFVEHRGGTSFGSTEKLKLIRKNNQTISRRYRNYDGKVQEFIRTDPLNTPRLALGLAWAGVRQKGQVPVYIAHDMGGGAENCLQAGLKSDLETGDAAVVLRVGGSSRWQIELHSNYGITRGETENTEFVAKLISILPARKIVYSCGVGDHSPHELPKIILDLASGPDDRIEVLVHDYFILSPSYTLLGSDGYFHGLPQSNSNTDHAHEAKRRDGTAIPLAEWRDCWGSLLEKAALITVFSQSSRKLIVEAYPQISERISLTPHHLLQAVPQLAPEQHAGRLPVIGVLGNIGYCKGASVLRDLCISLAASGQARLVVLGNVDPAYPLKPPAHIHGTYDIAQIPSLVSRYGITDWLIPSIWPETFSFTTHEAIATGLPVWGFDLGAQAEAIGQAAARTGQGGVISLHAGVPDIREVLATILENEAKITSLSLNNVQHEAA